MGLVDMLGLPSLVCWAGGNSANHIMAIISVAAPAARRMPMPRISATPMPSRPSMNSQLTQGSPAMLWKKLWNGPTSTLDRKPLVGEPPLIHDLADGVA